MPEIIENDFCTIGARCPPLRRAKKRGAPGSGSEGGGEGPRLSYGGQRRLRGGVSKGTNRSEI